MLLFSLTQLILVSAVVGQCANPRVRQEWNQLSAAQKTKYLNALKTLKTRPKGADGNPATWNYEQFADVHNVVSADNHGKPQFFVWHREFTNQFENALQSVDPTITVPYWDWRVDSQRPFQANVFGPNAFGGDGNTTAGNCVDTGVASGWKFTGDTACLKRCFRRNTIFFSPEATNSLISSSPNFVSIRNNLENGPHAAIHVAVGGACGHMNTMLSPSDPIFWLHHAMVDKLYDTWMGLCPEFKTDFGTLAPDYQLNPFPRTVSRVSDPQANGYCYSYSKSAGDNPAPKITCAGSPSVTVTMSGTATITVPVATPTSTAPAVNDIWFQMWVQTLVLGVNRMRVDPHQLDSSSQVAKRSIDEFMSKKLSNATTTVSNENSTHTTHSTHHDKVETIGSAKALKTATYVSLPVYFFSSNFTIAAPSPDDDQDLLNIRPTSYIEKDLFTKMHFDHKLFGEIVAFADMIDDQYNNKQGYTSVAALKYFRQNRTRVE